MFTVTSRVRFFVTKDDDGVPVDCIIDHPAAKDLLAQRHLEVMCEWHATAIFLSLQAAGAMQSQKAESIKETTATDIKNSCSTHQAVLFPAQIQISHCKYNQDSFSDDPGYEDSHFL